MLRYKINQKINKNKGAKDEFTREKLRQAGGDIGKVRANVKKVIEKETPLNVEFLQKTKVVFTA